MNKYRFAATVLAALLTLSACNVDTPSEEINNDPPVIEDPITEEPPVIEPPVIEPPVVEPPVIEEPIYTPNDGILYIRQNLPKMDGSTSLIPLEAGLRAKIFDISVSEATSSVNHTTTYGSFERLLNGEVDMIFSTPLSEDQYTQAKDKGLDLELVPIAAEAFVFVVNAENPVDTLTQQQIKDIYSGKITNWKEVGGDDAEIVALQRNRTSGSQNYMIDFMGETALMEAPSVTVPSSMEALMDAIVKYDNSKDSIGYSVYAYAADMYGLGDAMKFIKVDGIEPTKETMKDSSYPLTNYNYVIYDKNTETESVEKMTEWILSESGQTAIAEAGYIPAKTDVSIEYFELIGTGKERPEDLAAPTVEYSYSLKVQKILPENRPDEDGLKFKSEFDETPHPVLLGIKFEITDLKDKELQEKINKKIDEMARRADDRADEFIDFINKLNGNSEDLRKYYPYGFAYDSQYSSFPIKDGYYQPFKVKVNVKNGYLCIAVSMVYIDGSDIFDYNYYTETAYFDLSTGEEISLSDLFYKDTDVAKELNKIFSTFDFSIKTYFGYLDLKTFKDFTQFTSEDSFALTLDKIYFNYNNSILKDCTSFDIEFPFGTMISDEPRESGVFLGTGEPTTPSIIVKEYQTYELEEHNYAYLALLPENGPFADAHIKINSYMRDYLKNNVNEDIAENFKEELNMYTIDRFNAIEHMGRFVYFEKQNYGYIPEFNYLYPMETLMFDAVTGERIEITDIFKDGWTENFTVQSYHNISAAQMDEIKNGIIPEDFKFDRITDDTVVINGTRKSCLTFLFRGMTADGSSSNFILAVDRDYVNY